MLSNRSGVTRMMLQQVGNYTHGLSCKWTFLCRTVPNISELLCPLEVAIRHKFLPALTGQLALSGVERDLLALPSRLGGLGIINPVTSSDFQHLASSNISAPLTSLILQKSMKYPISCQESQRDCKRRAIKHKREIEQSRLLDLVKKLPTNYQRALPFISEKGASSWLAALPLSEDGYMLCIKRPSEMPFVFDMVGLYHFYHPIVFVDTIS